MVPVRPTPLLPLTLVDYHPLSWLVELLDFNLPISGCGKDGFLTTLESIFRFSVNTWDRGFMDKLYASTNAVGTELWQLCTITDSSKVGVASELILSLLNTNVYSPV